METFTDPRDNNVYKIVKIGNFLWFVDNLKYQGTPHYFPNRNSDAVRKYGCLYTWENAIRACPESWRLPTKEEFELLLITTRAYINSTSIRDPFWADGSNSRKFGMLPAGYRGYNDYYDYFGSRAFFWSNTPYNSDCAYRFRVDPDDANVNINYVYYAFSVRCIKEA